MERIAKIFQEFQVTLWGACDYSIIKNDLLNCRAKKRLPVQAQTVFSVLFPYLTNTPKGNLSRYAAVPDYHDIVCEQLQHIAERMKDIFSDHEFVVFCDNSPIIEVRAAAASGLGVIGTNGLLIHPQYGSYVFIGEIVTTLPYPCTGVQIEQCLGCNLCIKNCPGQALSSNGLDSTKCLSAITQKKGELSPFEINLIQKNSTIWGCDICQECCPMNRNAFATSIKIFQENVIPSLSPGMAANMEGRAFLWRGPAVVERNLYILNAFRNQDDMGQKI